MVRIFKEPTGKIIRSNGTLTMWQPIVFNLVAIRCLILDCASGTIVFDMLVNLFNRAMAFVPRSRETLLRKAMIPGEQIEFSKEAKKIGFSGRVTVLKAEPWTKPIERSHPIIRDSHEPWNIEKFIIPRRPIIIGEVDARKDFSCPIELAEGMVSSGGRYALKNPGEKHRVPVELMQFAPTIRKVIGFEEALGPEVNELYADLTIRQEVFQQGMWLNTQAPHTDAPRNAELFKRFYIVSDCVPTIFYVRPFGAKDYSGAFAEFNKDEKAKREAAWRPKPYEIVVGDRYTIHATDQVELEYLRTFLRIVYRRAE